MSKIILKNQFCNREFIIDDNTEKIYQLDGFKDSHGHILWLGMQILDLNLDNCKSFDEVISQTQKYQTESDWIIGRGWNESNWQEKFIPDLKKLDEIFPNKAIYLKRIDGHAAICNSLALKLANITFDTENPEGGKIDKKNGILTGLLIDNAMELINEVIPKLKDSEIENYILKAQEHLLSLGITSTCDMDVHLEWLPVFKKLAVENKLNLQIDQYIRGFDGKWIEEEIHPININNYSIKGLKFYADGALGSSGAALFEPYSDQPDTKGLFLIDEENLFNLAKIGCERNFEISTHAIGDAACNLVLNVYQKLRENGFKNILRIEHCQVIHPNDLKRFKEFDVEAHIQPIHCISDEKMAEERLGERVKNAYLWKSLIDTGAKVYFGSDYPIESVDPFLGIKALTKNNINWQQEEIIDLERAILLFIEKR